MQFLLLLTSNKDALTSKVVYVTDAMPNHTHAVYFRMSWLWSQLYNQV